ncbi:unnamed protein product [Amoebophrya sp. A25]|nr:unnamed protein product [Amoebophrya sp. A25]|eukprot:GSA25T00025002001.1
MSRPGRCPKVRPKRNPYNFGRAFRPVDHKREDRRHLSSRIARWNNQIKATRAGGGCGEPTDRPAAKESENESRVPQFKVLKL